MIYYTHIVLPDMFARTGESSLTDPTEIPESWFRKRCFPMASSLLKTNTVIPLEVDSHKSKFSFRYARFFSFFGFCFDSLDDPALKSQLLRNVAIKYDVKQISYSLYVHTFISFDCIIFFVLHPSSIRIDIYIYVCI